MAIPPCLTRKAAFTSQSKAAREARLHPLGKGLACTSWMPAWPGPKPVLAAMPRWPKRSPKLLPFGGRCRPKAAAHCLL